MARLGMRAACSKRGGGLNYAFSAWWRYTPQKRGLEVPASTALVVTGPERARLLRFASLLLRRIAAKWSLDGLSIAALVLVVAVMCATPVPVAASWLFAELWFVGWYAYVRVPRLSRGSKQHGSSGAEEPSALVDHAMQLFNKLVDPSEGALPVLQRFSHHVESWFMGGQAAIGPGNVADLLDHLLLKGHAKQTLGEDAESLLAQLAQDFCSLTGMQQQQQQQQHAVDQAPQVDQALHSLSDAGMSSVDQLAYKAEGAKPLGEALDLLLVCYRPLLFYVMMEGVAGWAHLTLRLKMGFTKAVSTKTATYYIRPGAPGHEQDTPIVFLHGIGAGLAPYLPFLSRMAARTGRPLIAVQYKHVSMRMTHHVPSAQQVAQDVRTVLKDHFAFSKVSLVAHSYGTLVAAALTKASPCMVAGLTLLDPVCFALFLPHLLRASLLFHLPSATGATGETASSAAAAVVAAASASAAAAEASAAVALDAATSASVGSIGLGSVGLRAPNLRWLPVGRWLSMRSLLKGVVVRDVHCAAALSRDAHWSELNLWPSDLPAGVPVRIVLSGNDHLVPVQEVVWMLSEFAPGSNVAVKVNDGRGHGAFVVDPALQHDIIESVLDEHGAITKVVEQQAGAAVVEEAAVHAVLQAAMAQAQLPVVQEVPAVVGLRFRPIRALQQVVRFRRQQPGGYGAGAAASGVRLPATAARGLGVQMVAQQARRFMGAAHAVLTWRLRMQQ